MMNIASNVRRNELATGDDVLRVVLGKLFTCVAHSTELNAKHRGNFGNRDVAIICRAFIADLEAAYVE